MRTYQSLLNLDNMSRIWPRSIGTSVFGRQDLERLEPTIMEFKFSGSVSDSPCGKLVLLKDVLELTFMYKKMSPLYFRLLICCL